MSSILKKEADRMRFEDERIWAQILSTIEHRKDVAACASAPSM